MPSAEQKTVWNYALMAAASLVHASSAPLAVLDGSSTTLLLLAAAALLLAAGITYRRHRERNKGLQKMLNAATLQHFWLTADDPALIGYFGLPRGLIMELHGIFLNLEPTSGASSRRNSSIMLLL